MADHPEYVTGSRPNSVTAADFNGDGTMDLAVADSSSNSVSVLLNNGGDVGRHLSF